MASLARASLESSRHTVVDAFLKSLKLHTRKLSALLAQHDTEVAVLERIYYINNNQHRAALFWKRVVEARRYSRRLKSCDVSSLINGLHRSFYSDPPNASSKPLKGAWSHYPPAPSFKSFLARLRICTALLDKTYVRMCAIYQMLTLAMRSGAFLHLVLTLTALVARLAHLSSAIRHVLSVLHAESIRLLDTLHPAEVTHNAIPPMPPPPPLLNGQDAELPSVALATTERMVPDSDLDMSTDLGEAIARPTTPFAPRPRSPMALDLLLPNHGASLAPAPVVGPGAATDDVPPIIPPFLTIRPSSHPAVVVKRRVAASEEPRQKKRAKAKRAQKRDEIDDIFS